MAYRLLKRHVSEEKKNLRSRETEFYWKDQKGENEWNERNHYYFFELRIENLIQRGVIKKKFMINSLEKTRKETINRSGV